VSLSTSSDSPQPRALGAFAPGSDIRDQLRGDHEKALAELEALQMERDTQRCYELLMQLRRGWVVHALAEETVVYRAIEGVEASESHHRADERFIEHELVEGLFDKLSRSRPGTLEWHSRLNVVRGLIMRHIQTEHDTMFRRLGERFDREALAQMAERFELTREKLTLLEDAKAA
jgi:hemerythrin HHE cation binding domain-containing protein